MEANDRLEASIRESIAATYVSGEKNAPLRFGRDTWKDSLNALLYERQTDPFIEWLESLPPWDNEARLPHWLGDVFKVDDACKLTEWASLYIPLGAVWRAYTPGEKLDETPVLIGEQGCGKSTALRWLLPHNTPEWFADGLHLAAPEKERAEALQGRVIVEASEMAGSNRADLESLKAFLTRTNDGTVRFAYRQNAETMLRRCVIVGTANDSHCLPNDSTGNRRFVSIRIQPTSDGAAGVRRYLDTYREQLWAEAKHLHDMGFPHPRLPDSLRQVQDRVNDAHRRRDDILEDELSAWLEHRTEPFALGECAHGVGLTDRLDAAKLDMRTTKRLGAALRVAGYENFYRRSGGTKTRQWRPIAT